MLPLPPVAPATGWRSSLRLPRDHYVRLDCNDYSVHPAVIGRRVEVDRRPAPGPGVLRRPAGRRPRTDLGLAPDHLRPRARRRGRTRCAGERVGAASGQRREPEVETACLDRLRHRPRPRRRRRGGVMAATAPRPGRSRDLAAEVAFLTRALKAPTLRESVTRLAERARAESWTHEEFLVACLQREVVRPRVPRRRGPDPGRPVPGPQEPGGVRLRPRPRPQTRHHRPPGHPGLRHRPGERGVPRPARHRQDPPGDRAGDPRLPSRAPGAVRHRRRMGRPARRPPTTPAGCKPSWSGSAATRCSSSTRSATSRSNPKPRTCSSNSSPPATNAPP